MKEFFVITTNHKTAKAIEIQMNQTNNHVHRSFELGKVTYEEGCADVQMVAKADTEISLEDVFVFGTMVGAQEVLGAKIVLKQEGEPIKRFKCGDKHIDSDS